MLNKNQKSRHKLPFQETGKNFRKLEPKNVKVNNKDKSRNVRDRKQMYNLKKSKQSHVKKATYLKRLLKFIKPWQYTSKN